MLPWILGASGLLLAIITWLWYDRKYSKSALVLEKQNSGILAESLEVEIDRIEAQEKLAEQVEKDKRREESKTAEEVVRSGDVGRAADVLRKPWSH